MNYHPMQATFTRSIDSLDSIFDLISAFVAKNQIGESVAFVIELAVEEIFVNMVKYNAGKSAGILINLSRDDARVTASLTDGEADAFDPTKREIYNGEQPLERRPIGGLGIHLTRSMMDRIEYEYSGGRSKTTLIKDLVKAPREPDV